MIFISLNSLVWFGLMHLGLTPVPRQVKEYLANPEAFAAAAPAAAAAPTAAAEEKPAEKEEEKGKSLLYNLGTYRYLIPCIHRGVRRRHGLRVVRLMCSLDSVLYVGSPVSHPTIVGYGEWFCRLMYIIMNAMSLNYPHVPEPCVPSKKGVHSGAESLKNGLAHAFSLEIGFLDRRSLNVPYF